MGFVTGGDTTLAHRDSLLPEFAMKAYDQERWSDVMPDCRPALKAYERLELPPHRRGGHRSV